MRLNDCSDWKTIFLDSVSRYGFPWTYMKSVSSSSNRSFMSSGASMLTLGTLSYTFFLRRTDLPLSSWIAGSPVISCALKTSSLVIGQLLKVPGVLSASLNCWSDGHPSRPCRVRANSAPYKCVTGSELIPTVVAWTTMNAETFLSTCLNSIP